MKNKILKGLKIASQALITIVLVTIIFITAIMLFGNDQYRAPNVFGYSFLNIATDSMEGSNPDSLAVNDLLIIKRNTDKGHLEVGKVITFKTVINGKPELNTHRIYERYEKSDGTFVYKTKGDNKPVDLDLVEPSDIVGVYSSKITNVGGFISFLQSPFGFFLLIVLPALLFLGYELIQFIRSLLDYKLEKQGVTNRVSEEELKAKLRAELLEEMKSQEVKK